jgi:hypothetical protein
MSEAQHPGLLRLTLARAIAWSLLVAGWVGLGAFATVLAPSTVVAFALIALWLFALGAAARVSLRGSAWARRAALALCALAVAASLVVAAHGAGMLALLPALVAWAALTALASGVVRNLRLLQPVPPGPPVAAATLGALAAALVLGDIGDLAALAVRLALFVVVAAGALMALQRADAAFPARASGCRAGLFDCSLPAWPSGAWRDARSWPTLLAGLAMLPMMAALPLMVAWCRAQAVPPQAMVLLHLAAMFVPALLLRHFVARWSGNALASVCAGCLVAGAVCVLQAPAPWDWIGLATLHGAAWGLAWAGQLWAPERRGRDGTSPLRAATGYALLTLGFGMVVEQFGAGGVAATHATLGLAALAAWGAGYWLRPVGAGPLPSRPRPHGGSERSERGGQQVGAGPLPSRPRPDSHEVAPNVAKGQQQRP